MAFIPEKSKLHLAMLALQFGYAGFHVVSRAALNMGVSKVVYLIYRNIIAFLLLAPFAYFLEKKERPVLTPLLLIQLFFLALCGITANQGFYLLGLDHTSPTFASAIQNSVPAITFLMAVAFGLEQVNMKRRDGVAKLSGTLACVGGASIITLYKGPSVTTLFSLPEPSNRNLSETHENWTLGCLFLICHCLSWSGWLVLQGPVLKRYPARLSVTSFTCLFGVLQLLGIAAFTEGDSKAWMINSHGELFTILYAGFVASGVAFAVQIWCIDRGGPVFVAVYQPVQTLVVAVVGSVTLGEKFYLGGILGAMLIITGLYLVLWGKREEGRFQKLALASSEHDQLQSGMNKEGGDYIQKQAPANILTQPLLPSLSPEMV